MGLEEETERRKKILLKLVEALQLAHDVGKLDLTEGLDIIFMAMTGSTPPERKEK